MADNNKIWFKKYAYYTLGVGLLLLGATQMTPAQKAMNGPTEKRNKIAPVDSVKTKASSRNGRKATYQSLSPKHKAVFHTLSKDDKQRVVDAHNRGDDPHEEMTDILEEDQDHHENLPENTSPQGSPAERAIEKHNMNKSKQNIYD